MNGAVKTMQWFNRQGLDVTQRHFLAAAIGAVVLMHGGNAAAQEGSGLVYMAAYIDYDAYHKALLDRCQMVQSDRGAALRSAIKTWTQHNQSALREVRVHLRGILATDTLNDIDDVMKRISEVGDEASKQMRQELLGESDSKTLSRCDVYPKELAGPDMDWVVWLDKLKAVSSPKSSTAMSAPKVSEKPEPKYLKAETTFGKYLNPSNDIPRGAFKAIYFDNAQPQVVVDTEIVKDIRVSHDWFETHDFHNKTFGGYWVGRFIFDKDTPRLISVNQGIATTRMIIDGLVAYRGYHKGKASYFFTKGEHLIEFEYLNDVHTEMNVTFTDE